MTLLFIRSVLLFVALQLTAYMTVPSNLNKDERERRGRDGGRWGGGRVSKEGSRKGEGGRSMSRKKQR